MTKEERVRVYDNATKQWGVQAQFDQLTEEMAELIVAINKYKRKHFIGDEYKDNPKIEENMIEELADVACCVEQISIMFGEENVARVAEEKMTNLQKLLDKLQKKN